MHDIVHSETDKNETHGGIIGLIRKEYKADNVIEVLKGRILNFSITDKGKQRKHSISVVYLPANQNLNVDVMKEIVHKLRLPQENELPNYTIIGDFNFIDNEKDKRNGLNSKDKQLNQI